jgi:hypothetical protein
VIRAVVPKTLVQKLSERAKAEGRTLSALVRFILIRAVNGE